MAWRWRRKLVWGALGRLCSGSLRSLGHQKDRRLKTAKPATRARARASGSAWPHTCNSACASASCNSHTPTDPRVRPKTAAVRIDCIDSWTAAEDAEAEAHDAAEAEAEAEAVAEDPTYVRRSPPSRSGSRRRPARACWSASTTTPRASQRRSRRGTAARRTASAATWACTTGAKTCATAAGGASRRGGGGRTRTARGPRAKLPRWRRRA